MNNFNTNSTFRTTPHKSGSSRKAKCSSIHCKGTWGNEETGRIL